MCHVVVEHIAILTLEKTFVCEGVPIPECLDDTVAVEHTEGKTAVETGLHIFPCGIMQVMAVHTEADTFHWDAGAFIHHKTREKMAVGYRKIRNLLVIGVAVEFHVMATHFQLDGIAADRRNGVGDDIQSFVRQIVGCEVSALVGKDAGFLLVVVRNFHFYAGYPCAVFHPDIAAHTSCVLAESFFHLG